MNERVDKVRAARPEVADLARALSLASRIDVRTMRRMRLQLFRSADVSTEADLWASPLVESRTPREIVFYAEVQAELRRELAQNADTLRAARAVIAASRSGGTPLLELEERITYLALQAKEAEVDEELRSVIKAMQADPSRQVDLSAWAARALTRLPPLVLQTPAARILGNVAAGVVVTPKAIAKLEAKPEEVRFIGKLQSRQKLLKFVLCRLGDELEVKPLTDPSEVFVEVPAGNPRLIVDEERSYRLDPRGPIKIPVRGAAPIIGTADGRRWLLGREQKRPNLDAITGQAGKAGFLLEAYLVRPDLAVSCAHPVFTEVRGDAWAGSLGFDGDVPATAIAVDEEADIALLRLDYRAKITPLELDEQVRQGQRWQAFSSSDETRVVGTIATGWPQVSLRPPPGGLPAESFPPGTPIFCEDKVIGHLRSKLDGSDGLIHITSARLIRWWVSQVEQPPQVVEPRTTPSARVFIHSSPSTNTPGQIDLRVGPSTERGDLIVLFVGSDDRKWPAAIYRVEGRQQDHGALATSSNAPSSAEVQCRLSVAWVMPPATDLDANQAEIRLLGGVTSQRDTRELNIHQRLIDLLGRLLEDDAVRTLVEGLLGTTLTERHNAQKLTLHLPAATSTAGIFGTTLEHGSQLKRFRRHSWGRYEIQLVVGAGGDVDRGPIRIEVRDVESDLRGAQAEFATRLFSNPGRETFSRAVAKQGAYGRVETILGRERGIFDMELIVNRLPGLSPAHAYRRAAQFITAVLDAMDNPLVARQSMIVRALGIGSRDLADVQRRLVQMLGDTTVAWIDPEVDVAELRYTAVPGLALGQVGQRLFNVEGLTNFVTLGEFLDPNDLLAGRFGWFGERQQRKLSVSLDDRTAYISVSEVRGYVRFYSSTADRKIISTRVRASDGRAEWRLDRRASDYTVGVVVEEEGLVLEGRILRWDSNDQSS